MRRIVGQSSALVLSVCFAVACNGQAGHNANGRDTGIAAVAAEPMMLGGSGPARTDQYVRGTDGNLWRRYSDTTEHGWENLGANGYAPFKGDPAAASWGAGHADVFMVNYIGTIDHGVQENVYLNQSSQKSIAKFHWVDNWGNPGNAYGVDVAVASGRRGLLDVFAVDYRATPNVLYHRRKDGCPASGSCVPCAYPKYCAQGTDSGWQSFSAPNAPQYILGRPAVAAGTYYPDSFDVFVTGINSMGDSPDIYHAYSDDGGVTIGGWENLGHPGFGSYTSMLSGSPAAASGYAGSIDVVVTDNSGAIKHLRTPDLWSWEWWDWATPMPPVKPSPALVATESISLQLSAVVKSDRSGIHCDWSAGWNGEGQISKCTYDSGVILGGVAATSWGSPWPSTYTLNTAAPGGPPNNEWQCDWTNNMQGVAHDPVARQWYWNNNKNIYMIPMDGDMTRFCDWFESWSSAGPWQVWLSGYNMWGGSKDNFHMGDPDFYNGRLYVPIETDNNTSYGQYLAIFNAGTNYAGPVIQTAVTPQQMPLQTSFPWLAINPKNGMLWAPVPSGNGEGIALEVYTIDNNLYLTPTKTVTLKYYDGVTPLNINDQVQGGAFSPNGHLYIAVGSGGGSNGVYAFDTDGTLQNVLKFPYDDQQHSCAGLVNIPNQEVEGMDIVDMADYPTSGMPGQIHMIRMNLHCVTNDGLTFQHWTTDASLF